ncbi:MAG: 3D domain-containing protein [Actinobacteria bacterium]|nr:3D domain-containing protein [Actinomycetota bacterium]
MKNFIKLIALLVIPVIFFTSFLFINPKKINAVTLQELSSEISQLSTNEQNLVQEILSTESLIEIKKNEIKVIDASIVQIEKDLKNLEDQRQILLKKLDSKREELKRIIISSYKFGKNNVLKLLISARNINEFIKTLYILKNIMRRNAELIQSIRIDKEEYDNILRKSDEKRKQLESTKITRQAEQKKLEVNLKKDNTLLAQVKNEKQTVQKTLTDIKARIAQVQPEGVILTGEWKMVATAYFSGGGGLNGTGTTYTGLKARKGIIAVDPSVIPLGTKLYVEGYGVAQAADIGGWIKGNRVDLCFESLEECMRYGRRKIYVYLVGN